jgi:hypothetical protein
MHKHTKAYTNPGHQGAYNFHDSFYNFLHISLMFFTFVYYYVSF